MAQRISRAKQRIRAAGRRASTLPPDAERAERLRVVLHVLYLIFNEGYTAVSGDRTCSAPTWPPRRSGWPGRCTACCPTTARSPACSR